MGVCVFGVNLRDRGFLCGSLDCVWFLTCFDCDQGVNIGIREWRKRSGRVVVTGKCVLPP